MKKQIIALLLLAVLCASPLSAVAEDLGFGEDLTEAQRSWIRDFKLYAPYWERFETVDVPGETWFRVYALPGDVYALYEYRQNELVMSFLIPGETIALLWDTGLGIGDIRACAEALTDLPITVLNSHNHPDHIGGNAQFDRVMCYDNEPAVERLTRGYTHEELEGFIVPEEIVRPPEGCFDGDTFFIPGKAPTATVEDGQVLDLGNRKLEVMYTPGHNNTSITLIDEQNGLLFTGDTWYPGPLYAFHEDASLPDYLESMRRIEAVIKEKNIQWVYGSHNAILPGTELICQTPAFLEQVMAGVLDYEEEDDMRVYKMNDLISLMVPLEDQSE